MQISIEDAIGSFKLKSLEAIVKWVATGEVFDEITTNVRMLANSELSGKEKYAIVYGKVSSTFGDVIGIVLKIAIEVAVLVMKAEIENASK